MQKMRSDYAKDPKPFRSQATKKGTAQVVPQPKLTVTRLLLITGTTLWFCAVAILFMIEFFNQF